METHEVVYLRIVANDRNPPNRIRALRETLGMTQVELARLANVHQTSLNKIEMGTRRLDQEWMRRLAPHLRVSPAELLPDEDNPLRLAEDELELLIRYRSATAAERRTFSRVAEAVLPGTSDNRADVA